MKESGRRNWTRQQLLVAFWLYCTESFGRLHARNPLIIKVAEQIGRSPSALAMKACNFASLDPRMVASGRVGLPNSSEADRALWNEFEANPTQIGVEACTLWESLENGLQRSRDEFLWIRPQGPTEEVREAPVRRVQRFFRDALLVTYEGKCAVTGLAIPELLVASHIVPWAEDERRRADPRNGILLNALLDRAFDRHLITFDEELRLVCSRHVHREPRSARQLLDLEGERLRLPERFAPDPMALAQHRSLVAA